jgi:hypothetical protein
LTGTLGIAVTLMGTQGWCTYREGLVALVAEGDLLLAPTAAMLLFVSADLGLAVGGMADIVLRGFADVGSFTGMLGLTDALAHIARLT